MMNSGIQMNRLEQMIDWKIHEREVKIFQKLFCNFDLKSDYKNKNKNSEHLLMNEGL